MDNYQIIRCFAGRYGLGGQPNCDAVLVSCNGMRWFLRLDLLGANRDLLADDDQMPMPSSPEEFQANAKKIAEKFFRKIYVRVKSYDGKRIFWDGK